MILVMLLGQSRVFYLHVARRPAAEAVFATFIRKFRTPWRSNLLFMVFTGLLAAFAPIRILGDMTSIGTLFAFVLVCGGIMIMRRTHPDLPRPFRTPLVPVVPILGIVVQLGHDVRTGLDQLGAAVRLDGDRPGRSTSRTAASTASRTIHKWQASRAARTIRSPADQHHARGGAPPGSAASCAQRATAPREVSPA